MNEDLNDTNTGYRSLARSMLLETQRRLLEGTQRLDLGDEEALEKYLDSVDYALLKECMSTLPKRHLEVISLYYGLDETRKQLSLEEIRDRFGITHERARQIKESGVRRIVREYSERR